MCLIVLIPRLIFVLCLIVERLLVHRWLPWRNLASFEVSVCILRLLNVVFVLLELVDEAGTVLRLIERLVALLVLLL